MTKVQMTTNPDKWARPAATAIVERFHTAVRDLVAERFATSGAKWEDVVNNRELELTQADFEQIEADLLATGYRFEMSAVVSRVESPEKYREPVTPPDAGNQPTDDAGRRILGHGDNVIRASEDRKGVARFVSSLDIVLEMLSDGVPDRTIAVIDDAGGTLTAPILDGFHGVICLGGTVRSHLAVLTREYGIPCLMGAELDGLQDGAEILVEYSRAPTDSGADGGNSDERARILALSVKDV